MARPAESTDFFVDVPNVGNFYFAKRKIRDELAVACEYSRLTEGITTPSPWLELVATWIAALKVLTVSAPAGWNIDEMDPHDSESYGKIGAVYTSLRNKEESFRQGKKAPVQAGGPGDGAVPGVLVPAPVQSTADGSSVP